MNDTYSAQGRRVDGARGYSVFEWTGPAVESGKRKRYSVQRRYGWDAEDFDTLEEALERLAALPALRVAEVTLKVYVPDGATEEQITEWVEFNVGANGSLGCANPLVDTELAAFDVSIDRVRPA